MMRLDRFTNGVVWAVALAFLALIAFGTPFVPITCADAECSCPTVTAQAATIEHQATVMARLWFSGVSARATIEAMRATATPPVALPRVTR